METNKHGKGGGSAFFWGLIIGALLATLLTNKRGRQILRDLTELGLELIEDLIQQQSQRNRHQEEVAEATPRQDSPRPDSGQADQAEDIESEITQVEEAPGAPLAENGHTKKRLFKGIRRSK